MTLATAAEAQQLFTINGQDYLCSLAPPPPPPSGESCDNLRLDLLPPTFTTPPGLLEAALIAKQSIVPRLADGTPSPTPLQTGMMAMLTVGYSITTQIDVRMAEIVSTYPDRHPRFKFYRRSQAGKQLPFWAAYPSSLWTNAVNYTTQNGLSPLNVQCAWVQAITVKSEGMIQLADLQAVIRNIKTCFPNCVLAYVSDSIYAGYTIGTPYANKVDEPFVYDQACLLAEWLANPDNFPEMVVLRKARWHNGSAYPCGWYSLDKHHLEPVGGYGVAGPMVADWWVDPVMDGVMRRAA